MKHLKKLTMTLVALFAVTAGAWADNPKVKYALNTGDTFTSGQTVEVKDGSDVVATITYGENGGNNFTEAKAATGDSALEGYTALTEGNGTNGNKTGGTFYTIVPVYDGTIDVAVVLNAEKSFYILEDGTALTDYNGKTVTSKYYGTYSFAVKAGKSYKLYCAGSKLGFYGFEYTYTPATKVTPTANANEWSFKMPAGDVELEILYKAQSQMALTFGGEDIDAEKGLTGYLNLEDEFAGSLGFAIEGLDAAMGFTFESDNTAVMAFGENNEATGTLQDIKFLAVGDANLTIKFAGNDDYSRAEATVKVMVKEKDWTVTLNDGGVDTQNWTIDPATATTDGVKAGTEVKATYSGTKRVKSIKAVVTAAP